MAIASICKCGIEIDKIDDMDAVEHAKHYVRKMLETSEIQASGRGSITGC